MGRNLDGKGYVLFATMMSNMLSEHFLILFTNLGVGFFGLAILAHVTNNVHKVMESEQFSTISILSWQAIAHHKEKISK